MVRGWLSATGDRVAVRVPAKINPFLAVRRRRTDGYHDLTTVMQTLSLYDVVTARLAGPPGRSQHPAARRRMGLEVCCDDEAVPGGSHNLALRAARLLGETTNVLAGPSDDDAADATASQADGPVTAGPTGIADAASGQPGGEAWPSAEAVWGPSFSGARTVVELDKAIPVAAGLAGGSADAAGALRALNALWACDLDEGQLRDVGAEIGSDVPFCVIGGTALVTGRGEALARVLCHSKFHWVVGIDASPLATGEVYRAWDAGWAPSDIEPDAVLAALRAGDAEALGPALHNELQPPAIALRPHLETGRRALLAAGALGAVVSGSGPTALGLARDAEHAQQLAAATADRFHAVRVATSPAGGPEPVDEAR